MEDFSKLRPGTPENIDVKESWTLENSIEWEEHFTAQLRKTLAFHEKRLQALYRQREWWVRFIHYCNTGK